MKCIVCSGRMDFYFRKSTTLRDYYRCIDCGLVQMDISKTDRERVNVDSHNYLGDDQNPNDPRWLPRLQSQAKVISELRGLLPHPWLDWGSGDGKLAELIKDFGLEMDTYDKYNDPRPISKRYGFVITTSVFEHLYTREELNEIDSLAWEVMGLHTMVVNEVPADPEWFYYLPPHVTFFTNESMRILFKQWGYEYSIYHPEARLWLWFRHEPYAIDFVGKEGFVDYWK